MNCAVEDAYFEIVQKGEGINKNKIGFRNYIGGLCGYSKDSINVNNCYVNHCVILSNLDNYNGNYGYQIETHVIGGLVGCTDDKAKVAYCYANVAIDTNVDDTVFSIPAARLGGLVGMANVEKVSVKNCIAQFLPLDNLNGGEMSLSNLFNYLGDIEDISTAISNLYYIATEIEFDKQDVDLASNAITKGDLSNIFLRNLGFNGSIWSVVDGEIRFNIIRNYK